MSTALMDKIRERCAAERAIPKCHWCDCDAFYDFRGPLLCVPCVAQLLSRCHIDNLSKLPPCDFAVEGAPAALPPASVPEAAVGAINSNSARQSDAPVVAASSPLGRAAGAAFDAGPIPEFLDRNRNTDTSAILASSAIDPNDFFAVDEVFPSNCIGA